MASATRALRITAVTLVIALHPVLLLLGVSIYQSQGRLGTGALLVLFWIRERIEAPLLTNIYTWQRILDRPKPVYNIEGH